VLVATARRLTAHSWLDHPEGPTWHGVFTYRTSGADAGRYDQSRAAKAVRSPRPAERFNHVHLYQEDPFCAQLWYQQHLHAPVYAGRTSRTPLTEATCQMARGPDRTWPTLEREGMFRTPRAAVAFGDVAWLWYMRQGDRALVSSRGHVADHLALSVADLDRNVRRAVPSGSA
jgi:hypothetical protein